ncbi:hypothetical protein LU276_02790 [Moraxella haemolytica]|uniref:hypothetical protein n=1 Tax=Moraxella haemolytica TaxID=2904119 RepID=UPI0025431818|nr:hypothetical protein [Moraxella sp. ZY171148]WII95776.1 hypothetical protein LU276_02790 [Moraxella sp. ZY171148]
MTNQLLINRFKTLMNDATLLNFATSSPHRLDNLAIIKKPNSLSESAHLSHLVITTGYLD